MKKQSKFSIFYTILFIVLALYVLTLVFMFGWGFLTSFRLEDELYGGIGYSDSTVAFPNPWHFDNYLYVFTQMTVKMPNGRMFGLSDMAINTLLYVFGTAFVSTFMPCIVAYLIATYNKFAFSKIVYGFVLVTMMLPIVGAAPSVISVLHVLTYYDSIVGMWLMNLNFLVGIHFLVFYDAFKGLSQTYKEAAEIDGASQIRIMFSVMIPLVKTIFITVFILRFIAYWNDYQTPLLYMPNHPTVAYGIFQFFFADTNPESRKIPAQLASVFTIAIPIIFVFILCQKRIMRNVTIGGIKE